MRSARASDGEGGGRRACGGVEFRCRRPGAREKSETLKIGTAETPRRREVVAGRGSANFAWARGSFRDGNGPGAAEIFAPGVLFVFSCVSCSLYFLEICWFRARRRRPPVRGDANIAVSVLCCGEKKNLKRWSPWNCGLIVTALLFSFSCV
jgi:hypothetical protein